MNLLPWLLLLLVVLLGTVGQLSLKYAINPSSTASSSPKKSLLLSRYFWVWFVSYVLVTVLWLFVLRTIPLNQAFPILGLTYGLVPLASHQFLNEKLVFSQWLGIIILITGVVIVAQK